MGLPVMVIRGVGVMVVSRVEPYWVMVKRSVASGGMSHIG